MKRVFSILLTCCTAFCFAEDDSFFEETDEKVQLSVSIPFAAEEPIFEEEDEPTQAAEKRAECEDECGGCDECDDGDHEDDKSNEPTGPALIQLPTLCTPQIPTEIRRPAEDRHASYVSWRRYKANFGMEKLFIRFPQKPALSQTSTLLTAYAYDNAVLYSLVGFFPPMGNIDPISYFDSVLYSVDHYPFTLISHVIFQVSNGDWVMDYVAHDYIQNLIIKARAIVTPFNAYTLQCVKPNGMRDYFEYYLDNFFLKCEYGD